MRTKEISAIISIADEERDNIVETSKFKYKLPITPLQKIYCTSLFIDNVADVDFKNKHISLTFGNGLRTIIIPSGIIELPYKYFCGCKKLISVELPDSIQHLSENCFSSCNELENITIPPKVTTIPSRCFSGSRKLQNIQLPNQLTAIEEGAFSNCTSLKKLKLPETLETIEKSAFFCCSALQSIHIPSNVSSIGDRSFFQCTSLTEINVPLQFLSDKIFNFTNMPQLSTIKSKGKTLVSLHQHDTFKNLIKNQNLMLVQYINKDKKQINSVIPIRTNNLSSNNLTNKHLTECFNNIYNHPIFEQIEDSNLKIKLCLNMISTLKPNTAIKFLNDLHSKDNKDCNSVIEVSKSKATFIDKLKSFFSKFSFTKKQLNDSTENNRSGITSKTILINLFKNVNCDTSIEEFDQFFRLNMRNLIDCNDECILNNMVNIQNKFNTILQMPQIREKLNSGELNISVLAKYLLNHGETDTDDNNSIPYSNNVNFKVNESNSLNYEKTKEIDDR